MTPLKFNADTFGRAWVSSRATRWLRSNIFDPLGHTNLKYLIEGNHSFVRQIPTQGLAQYLRNFPEMEKFTEEEFYSWIPKEYRQTIEALPNGKEWAMSEMRLLKSFIK